MVLRLLAVAASVVLALGAQAQVADTPDLVLTAHAGEDQTIECTSPAGAFVKLDGSRSHPATNDTIASYAWSEGERVLGHGETLQLTLPRGEHDIRLTVTNATNATAVDDVRVSVVDTTPPHLVATASVPSLWPPNHKVVPVTVAVTTGDACGGASFALVSVTSSEPADGRGDGHTSPDIVDAEPGTPDTSFGLRSERSGGGAGRAYAATYRATDEAGNAVEAAAVVLVPHG